MDELLNEKYVGRESKILEFKSTVKSFDNIKKTCVAFANGVGGKIVIGVEDKTQKILGVDENCRDRIYDDFPNSLYDSTSPHLLPQIYEQLLNNQTVIIIEIPPSLKRPCFLTAEGIPKGVYLRVGSSTRRAGDDYIEELMRESRRISFDEEIVNADIEILSKDLLDEYYHKINKTILLEDKIITHSPANSEKLQPTIAGILLFNHQPDRYLPEAHVLCTRFAGTSGRDIIQTEEITGSIQKQIAVSFNLVYSWLKRDFFLLNTKLKSKSLIPKVALREAIINAVIHRKYWIPGAIKISLYDDRLEIFSPGNFPGHVSTDNLGDGITHLRNPIIGRMAHKMGIIEKLGSGIRMIFESCEQNKMMKPEFKEDGDYVKVIFYFHPAKDLKKSDRELIMELLHEKQIVTIREMVDYSGRSKNTIFKVLNTLLEKGMVKRIGKGRATRYILP